EAARTANIQSFRNLSSTQASPLVPDQWTASGPCTRPLSWPWQFPHAGAHDGGWSQKAYLGSTCRRPYWCRSAARLLSGLRLWLTQMSHGGAAGSQRDEMRLQKPIGLQWLRSAARCWPYTSAAPIFARVEPAIIRAASATPRRPTKAQRLRRISLRCSSSEHATRDRISGNYFTPPWIS